MVKTAFDPKLEAYARSHTGDVVDMRGTSDELLDNDMQRWSIKVDYALCVMDDGSQHAQDHRVIVSWYDMEAEDGEEWTEIDPSKYRLPRPIRTVYNRAVKEFEGVT